MPCRLLLVFPPIDSTSTRAQCRLSTAGRRHQSLAPNDPKLSSFNFNLADTSSWLTCNTRHFLYDGIKMEARCHLRFSAIDVLNSARTMVPNKSSASV